MGKGVRAGIIVEAIVLVIAIVLSVAYVQMGLFRENGGMDIWLLMLWVLVAAVALFVLWWRSLTREEMVRRFYIAADGLYNHELGFVPMGEAAPEGNADELAAFMATSLVNLTYKFDVAEPPEGFVPAYVVTTRLIQTSTKTNPTKDSITQWKGSVVKVGTPGDESTYTELASYESEAELAEALRAHNVI